MRKILNLTQHAATHEQVAQGVFEPTNKELVQRLLTFDKLPNFKEIARVAATLARLAQASGAKHALIGGAPFLMSLLEYELKVHGVDPLYAFSVRESVEQVLPDGSVKKTNVFRHAGFIEL